MCVCRGGVGVVVVVHELLVGKRRKEEEEEEEEEKDDERRRRSCATIFCKIFLQYFLRYSRSSETHREQAPVSDDTTEPPSVVSKEARGRSLARGRTHGTPGMLEPRVGHARDAL